MDLKANDWVYFTYNKEVKCARFMTYKLGYKFVMLLSKDNIVYDNIPAEKCYLLYRLNMTPEDMIEDNDNGISGKV